MNDFTKSNTNLVDGEIYRHQFKDLDVQLFNDFKKHFREVVKKVKKEIKILHILGDFNCNFHTLRRNLGKIFLNDLGLKLLITKPTKVKKLTRAHYEPSLIDHIYANDKQAQNQIAGIIIETNDKSDHQPIISMFFY